MNVCGSERVRVQGGRGGVQSSTREALLGAEARGSPEGTARLEEPLAGQQLNKRWEGSVSLEGQERWEAPRLNAEDKQMLAETEKKGRKVRRMTEGQKKNFYLLYNFTYTGCGAHRALSFIPYYKAMFILSED